MKPLEFKIEETFEEDIDKHFTITFFNEDGTTETIALGCMPKGLELNRHYFIGDLYGEPVVDDRKGL